MRITCPSCSSSFEIPSELLGKKGRALKCASCGHSWYQAAQVDSLDLASIMGDDYAAKAKAKTKAAPAPKMRNEVRPLTQGGAQGQARQPQGAPPLPPGARSMMHSKQPGQAPTQKVAPLGQRAPQQRQIQQAGLGAPKSKAAAQAAALSGKSMRGADANAGPGEGAVSWMHPTGGQGGPGAPGQSVAGPGGVQGGPGAPGQPLGGPAGTQGGPGAPGQSMRGPDNMAGPGEDAVSWMENKDANQGAPGSPGQSMAGPGGAQGGPGAPGQSMRGPDKMAGPGEEAVSWMGNKGANQGAPGAPGQSMAGPGGAQGGPGAPGQSMRGPDGAAAPGEDAVSWMDKDKAGGAAGESMMAAGASGGPGQGPGSQAVDGASGEEAGRGAKAEGELLEHEARTKKSETEWADGDNADDALNGESPELGASGGPGAAKSPDDDVSDDDDEDDGDLVDPDADRPDFGSADDDDADGSDEDDDDGSDDDDEDVEGPIAARTVGRRGARQKRRKPIDPAYVTAGIMGAAVLSLALMVWFGRGLLMDLWPGIAGFYDSVGMEAEQPGGGLSISETGKRLVRVGGVETLIVRGFVSNISDVAKPVPGLRLELFDQRDDVIQDAEATTATSLLDPGSTVEFELRMQLPQLDAAQGYRVVWDNN